tara:strand:+ start:1176 stop:1517 length:342 start_codon:yes stop_codon:yes gene_type:complete
LYNSSNVSAKESLTKDNTFIENKLASKFTKKFCNSIAFGISQESALRFTAGEDRKEASRKKYLENIDFEDLENNIASSVVNTCGLPLGLSGQKGVAEFKLFLSESGELDYFKK